MRIKTQWGVIAYNPQAIACDADLTEMADAAFGEGAAEWLDHRTGYRPGMTCAQAWGMIAARALRNPYFCAMCGGMGMTHGIKPDEDVMNTPCPECNPNALP
jgi:hypothetical protein